METSYKQAVLDALSENTEGEIRERLQNGCLWIMAYVPTTLDRGSFLKITLPIFARVFHKNPDKIASANDYAASVCYFVETRAIAYLLDNPIDDIDEAAWFDGLAEQYEAFTQ